MLERLEQKEREPSDNAIDPEKHIDNRDGTEESPKVSTRLQDELETSDSERPEKREQVTSSMLESMGDQFSESATDSEQFVQLTLGSELERCQSGEQHSSEVVSEEENSTTSIQDRYSLQTPQASEDTIHPDTRQEMREESDRKVMQSDEECARIREEDERREERKSPESSKQTRRSENSKPQDEIQEKVSAIRERLEDVDSYEKLKDCLDHPYHEAHTKTQVSYQKDMESAGKYYEFLEEIEKGGSIREVSKRVGIGQPSGSRYLEGRIPRLIQTAMEPTPEYHIDETAEQYRIRSPEKYEQALERHSFVKDLPDFAELDREARVFVTVMGLKERNELPDKMVKDLAKDYGVGKQRLASWLSERKTQELVHRLESYEQAREEYEGKFAKEAFEHRIDPSTVYENFRHLREVKHPTSEELAGSLERLITSSDRETRVQWAELREYHYGGPRWLREVATAIADDRENIENLLNQRIGLDKNPDEMIRIGVLDSKVYLRRADMSEYNWLNIYKNEAFYFHSVREKNQLVDEAKARLGVDGGTRLSYLTDQLTDKVRQVTSGTPDYDLSRNTHHLRGESLALVLDTHGEKIQDIEGRIKRIGKTMSGSGGISNPRFPEDKIEIDSMFASVLGAGLSDGHVARDNKGFIYTESNRARVDIFHKEVSRFGGVYRSEGIRENGVIAVRFSSVFGRTLERRGLISGDKSLQNEGFPDWLKRASPEVLQKYYGPMWAQDGSFKRRKDCNGAEFQVDRGVVLLDPTKSDRYDIKSEIKSDHIKLVTEFGNPEKSERFGSTKKLTGGILESLSNHSDSEIANSASELSTIIGKNQSKLMIDEIKGLEKFGVVSIPCLANITYYEGTGRLSILWHYGTSTKKGAMIVALACGPEDIVKKKKVEKWIESEPELAKEVLEELDEKRVLRKY